MFREPVLERFPEPLRRLETGLSYSVKIADTLIELSKQVGRRLTEHELAYGRKNCM